MAADPTSPDIELSTPTLLKVLLRQQHKQRYETFCLEFERAAEQVATDAPPPSKAQFHRWLSGHLKGGVPYPDACRVLEAMFPPWSAVDLCRPYDPDRYLAPNDSRPAPGNLLQSVPSSFPAGALEGDWVTCFKFRHHNDSTWLCHADIVHISAES
ncbi:MAG: hypothetical protein J2P57_25035, partial [Acidimicrobiaceae bacterium]|nr:hypothetical protein [Acidimicrobiaceae bacterium]